MLNRKAFANSLAVVTGVFYLAFYFLDLIAPKFFIFIFNAQFFGANVASLMPEDFPFSIFIGTFVLVILSAWIFGYFWAWAYGKFSK